MEGNCPRDSLQMLARSRSSVSECFSAFAPHLFVLTHDSANQEPYLSDYGRRANKTGFFLGGKEGNALFHGGSSRNLV
jgi:hypothetical protein